MMRKKGEGSEWRQVRNLDSLESENDSYIADLEARVQGLKELSLAMRDEVQASNTLLGTMVGRLEGVRVSVRNSVRRMDQMFKSGACGTLSRTEGDGVQEEGGAVSANTYQLDYTHSAPSKPPRTSSPTALHHHTVD
ncbi:hypothetical protein cyc_07212 [Cyclospora cayetanensis]|uniref:t-SNARE coiled-coil homology domain-containing protein n=1 Tax=Cyclospora cayetanensis TaxID=88456 RepID=A0A1D3D1M1_9EIME|nr:hypothetical protein cyc_07212 [Cyclospora cayetanensis]